MQILQFLFDVIEIITLKRGSTSRTLALIKQVNLLVDGSDDHIHFGDFLMLRTLRRIILGELLVDGFHSVIILKDACVEFGNTLIVSLNLLKGTLTRVLLLRLDHLVIG